MAEDSSPSPPRYEEEDYEEVYYHFDDYCQEIILANASKFLTPPEPAEHYEWEEVILDEVSQAEWEGIKKSFCFGIGCGLLGLGALRWRRSTHSKGMGKYMSSSTSASGGYKFDPMPPKPYALHDAAGGGYSNSINSRAGLLFDVTLATLLGVGTSLLSVEYDVFYPTGSSDGSGSSVEPPPQWISPAIPLVPGRSIIAETLCGPLAEEFRRFPKQLWQSSANTENGYNHHIALYANSGWKATKYYEGNDNASVVSLGEDEYDARGTYERLVLDSLQGFIINCERRSRHEEKLRKIRGLRKGQPVLIPEQGVAADEDLELDDIYLIGTEVRGEEDDLGRQL